MKRTFGVLVVLLLLVLSVVVFVSPELFGAGGCRMTRTIPKPAVLVSAESAWVNMDTLVTSWAGPRFVDLDQYRKMGATRMIVSSRIIIADTDIDSFYQRIRLTDDGLNCIVADSQKCLTSTAGSAVYKDYPLDSLYQFQYGQVNLMIFGDAAGTAIQTITVRTDVMFLDYQGRMVARLTSGPLSTSFQE